MGSDPRKEMKSNSGQPFARKVPGFLHPFWTGMLMEEAEFSLKMRLLTYLAQKNSKDESDLRTS
jgi:hypothetical protein